MSKKYNYKALLPIGVFVILYLGLGILFEYILKIPMGFYNIPIVCTFLISLLVACIQNRTLNFSEKLELMGKGIGDKNIITMIIIFLCAGAFVGVVGRDSANSVAYFILSLIPAKFAVSALFLISCFVSLAMGTSVGTITLLSPIGVSLATASGFGVPLCLGAVMGGAMFGDNLSFISDTTIAACQGQGVPMQTKFKENFKIALPAAIIALVATQLLSFKNFTGQAVALQDYNLVEIIPYILVLLGGIAGINVFFVLLIGIVSGSIIILAEGNVSFYDLLSNMGAGVSGMFETAMVAVLVAAICELVKAYGGFEALLHVISKLFHGKKGGQLGVGLLVGAMDIATANNTVAIVMANPIASQMAEKYGFSFKKTASLLDTFSCIFQGIIPYGAQMLVLLSAATALGQNIDAFDVMPYLSYPFCLLFTSLIFIFVIPERNGKGTKQVKEAENVTE